MTDVRAACHGLPPLSGRLEPWQRTLCADHGALDALLQEHGSPVNLLEPTALRRNVGELQDAARQAGVDLRVYVARKANKALAFVDEAARRDLGVDLASERELLQALDRGVAPDRLVMTAAVKPARLLDRCIEAGVTVALDNADEAALFVARGGTTAAVRLAPEIPDRLPTRFGMSAVEVHAVLDAHPALRVCGVHFHLDGYAADHRVLALEQALELTDALRSTGHPVGFVDIGGGIPMSYLDSREEWEAFWAAHRAALLGRGAEVTFDGHPLGLRVDEDEVTGSPNVYPYHQAPVRGPWLARVLGASLPGGGSVADAVRDRDLELRCEPGRSVLDGCGMTAARVAHRKRRADGTWLVSLEMNRTQCRSTSDDFLVDPLLVRASPEPGDAIDAYLVGAYCIERELLSLRRLRFPRGVDVGDVVVFPNTAGYLMHILESASHQIPLARNLVLGPDGTTTLDAIDAVELRV